MEISDIISLFTDRKIARHSMKDTSRGEADFRLAVFVQFKREESDEERKVPYDLVIKLADNDFTTVGRLEAMQRMAEEYRRLGYYCPRYSRALDGTFPFLEYNGRRCIAYAEEYSIYKSAEQFEEASITGADGRYLYFDEAMRMNARIAGRYFDFTELPSAYCLFQPFSESDKIDEVMDNAMEWKKTADGLPPQFAEQVERIWNRYMENRNELETYYGQLPTSVFQADLNHTNILLDETGKFAGIYDFNLCGRDVFLNYLIREVPYIDYGQKVDFAQKAPMADRVWHALSVVSEIYHFNELEKKAALPLWRCLKPLWWTSIQSLKEAVGDPDKIQKELDRVEEEQTREIDFEAAMK